MQIHSDCQKLRRSALQLLAAGDLRRLLPDAPRPATAPLISRAALLRRLD